MTLSDGRSGIDEFERRLVAKAVVTGRVDKVVDSGIEVGHFVSQAVRDVWTDVVDYVKTYRTCPTVDAFRKMHPTWDLPLVEEPIDYLIDQMRSDVKRRIVTGAMREVAEFMRDNPTEWSRADQVLFDKARSVFREVPDRKTEHFRDMRSRVDLYLARKGAGLTSMGIPFGIPSIDYETGGIQSHEMVTVLGFSGVGKSTLMQYIAHHGFKCGKRVLFLSLEMGAEPIFRRFDSLETHLPSKSMKDFALTDTQVDEWREKAEELEKLSGDIIVLDNLGQIGVSDVWRYSERHRPDIVVIDYVNLMKSTLPESAAMWEKVTQITRELKRMTGILKIPVLAAAQTNAEGATKGGDVTTVGYSRSIVQDSDVVLGIHRTEEMRDNRQMEVRLAKNRDGRNVTVNMLWDLDTMTIHEWTTGDEIMQAWGPPKSSESSS